ncbi:MAG: hypothetical protein HYU64_05470 [Armatimonadetes bacterium]|nr:hypothetical protein [Armatimonadota bacterium]
MSNSSLDFIMEKTFSSPHVIRHGRTSREDLTGGGMNVFSHNVVGTDNEGKIKADEYSRTWVYGTSEGNDFFVTLTDMDDNKNLTAKVLRNSENKATLDIVNWQGGEFAEIFVPLGEMSGEDQEKVNKQLQNREFKEIKVSQNNGGLCGIRCETATGEFTGYVRLNNENTGPIFIPE